ncbi:MAG: hypothetical protein Ct9H300mP15_30250 [Gemmatimonadota bacterium]|nr:MAG: hypothetical protein Ct9H300mP15_30250 [Gemmatimonadota bacterium]
MEFLDQVGRQISSRSAMGIQVLILLEMYARAKREEQNELIWVLIPPLPRVIPNHKKT